MILLLNYLPILLFCTFAFLALHFLAKKSYKWSALWACVALIVPYSVNTVSVNHFPKGTVQPQKVIIFEKSDAQVQDRLRSPEMNSDERRQKFNERVDRSENAAKIGE